jgi:hypothetical protein
MTTRVCTGCGMDRPLGDFQRDPKSKDGRRARCVHCLNPLPAQIRSQTGLSPAQRAELDAEAKAAALEFTWAVKTRNAAKVQKIAGPMSKEQAVALAIVLAEAVTPGMRLAEVTRVTDDGMPAGLSGRVSA